LPITSAVSKGQLSPPFDFPQTPLCRKLFTILPTLIVNNNNNKRRRSSCAKFQNNPIQAATNKKKPRKYREKQQHQEEKPEKRKVGKHFTLMTVQVFCSRRCRHGCHSNGSLNFTLTAGIVATF